MIRSRNTTSQSSIGRRLTFGPTTRQVHHRKRLRRLLLEQLEVRKVMAADWRNPVDSFDTNDDGFISAIDALVIINELNSVGAHSLPRERPADADYLDVTGDQFVAPRDVLLIINYLNVGQGGQRLLAERGRLANEAEVTITLGQDSGARNYRVQLDATFDTSDKQAALEDLLAVYLVDASKPEQTLMGRGTEGTSIFTLSDGAAEYRPGQVRWDGKVLDIDLSALGSFDTGILKFQLLSSDADNGTRVVIKPLDNQVEPAAVSVPLFVNPTAPLRAGVAANLANLSPAPNIEVHIENVRFNSTTGRYAAELRLENHDDSVGSEIVVAFPGLPAQVTLRDASGLTAAGVPYLNLRPAIAAGGLGRNMRSEAVLFEFDDPTQALFKLSPQVFASVNRAPTLNAIAPLIVSPGGVVTAQLVSQDLDGDRITYSIREAQTLPKGELRADGSLVFRPQPDQLGTYQFQVVASDGLLEATRSVTLNVVADPLTTTRISGRVLQVNGQPLANMPVDVGAIRGLTAADGSFTVDLGTGTVVSDTLKVRGELFSGSAAYPFIAEKIAFVLDHPIFLGSNNVIDRPIYLPALDLANGKTIDPARDINVTTDAIPGASVLIKSGTLMNQQGTPFTGLLSITEVPSNRTPAALPDNIDPELVVTIQPGEMVFATPAPMTFPNRAGWAPGTRMNLLSINPVTGQFDDVGDMQVSPDGRLIETISGGVRNSSWHFPEPPEPEPEIPDLLPPNPEDNCDECKDFSGGNSVVELHSGAEIESHSLVPYMSQGTSRTWTLTYDSQRADPRPIIHLGYKNTQPFANLKLVASISLTRDDFTYQIPGYTGGQYGLDAGDHVWAISPDSPDAEVALQADLRKAPTGSYQATIRSGLKQFTGTNFFGTSTDAHLNVTHVNSIDSPFGSGWGIDGLTEIVENPDRSILIVDGGGSELLYRPPAIAGQAYVSPPGNFSTLIRQPDQSFRLTSKDRTVSVFNQQNKIASVTDRNGNVTSFSYDGQGRLVNITDPVGLVTHLSIGANGRVSQITDPAGRTTKMEYDADGNLTRITDPDNTSRTWQYDAGHRMTSEVDQRGMKEHTIYDFAGRVAQAILKDGAVRKFQPLQVRNLLSPTATINPLAPPLTGNRSNAAYVADENGNVTVTVLDRAGQAVSSFDRTGPLPTYARNNQNLISSQLDGRGHITLYEYDSRGNITSIRDESSGGSSILGAIVLTGERDVYTFNGLVGQRVLYDGLSSANDDLRVQLLSPAGEVVFLNHDELDSGPFVLNRSGEYRLEIFGNDSSTGDYAFTLYSAPTTIERIQPGQEIVGELRVPGELDVFTFQGAIGQRIFYDGLGSTSDDLRVQLVSPTGRQLFFDHDEANSVPFSLDEDGIYLLNLFGAGDSVGDYHFQFVESNVAVVSLALGSNTAGTLERPGDLDVYTFTGLVGQRLYYDGLASASDDLRVNLVSPSGQQLFFNHDESNEGGYVLAESGTYRLNLFGQGDAVGDYRFRLLNATVTTALLTIGAAVSGDLLLPGDVHTFTFNGGIGQHLYYDGLASANDDLRVNFVTPTGRQLFINNDESNDGTYTLDEAGEYRFNIFGSSDAIGDYHFRVVEPAFNLSSLTIGVDVTGTLNLPGEFDAFFFTGHIGQRLFYDGLTSANDDLRVNLVSPTGLQIFLNNDEANDGAHTLEEDGIYRLNFFGQSDAVGDYHFRMVEPTVNKTTLSFGAEITGALSLPGELDIFTFNGVIGQQLYYDALSSADDDLRFNLVTPAGRQLLFNNDETNDGPVTLDEAGPYRLNFFGSSDATGDYRFRLVEGGSRLLSIGSIETNSLSPGDSTSTYRFIGTQGQRLNFDSLTTGTAQWNLRGPSGQLINSNLSQNTDFTVMLPSDGPYTLVLLGSTPASDVPFSFQVNDVSDASVIPTGFNQQHSGSIAAGQVATFTYNAPAGMRILFDGRLNTNTANLRAEMRDSQNTQVFFSDDMADRGPVVLQRSGTYTLTVRGDTAINTGDYRFSLLSLQSGPALTPDQSITGELAPFEIKPFVWDADLGGRFTYDSLESDFDNVSVLFYGPLGDLLFNTNADSNVGPLNLVEAGRYQLLVINNTAETRDFKFRPVKSTFQSQALTFGTTVSDQLAAPGDEKQYLLIGAVGQRLYYDSLESDFSVATRKRLVSPSGAVIWNDNTDSNSGPITLTESGNYLLRITGDNDSVGTYSFRVLSSTLAVQPLAIGTTVNDQLTAPGNEKHYTFEGAVGQQLYYDSLQSDFSIPTRKRLISPRGTVIWHDNTDSNSGPITLVEAGTYRLRVTSDTDAVGTFSFRILQPTLTTQPLTLGAVISDQLAGPGDEKQFTLTGAVGQKLFYDSLQSDFSIPTRKRLVAPSGAVLFNDNTDSNSGPLTLTETGTYRLRITSDTDAVGTFSFRIVQPTFAVLPINLGTTVSDQLAGPGDEKRFTFTGAKGQQVFYDSLQNDFSIPTRKRLIAPSGTVYWNDNTDSNSGPLTLTEAGVYHLRITADNDAFGSFAFRIVSSTIDSHALSLGASVFDQLIGPGDEEQYLFSGEAGQRIVYDALQNDGAIPTRKRLVTPSGRVFWNDNTDSNTEPLTLFETGVYRLRITSDTDAVGTFGFRVLSLDAAPVVPLDTNIDGTITPLGTAYFQLRGESGRRLLFDALKGSGLSWSLYGVGDAAIGGNAGYSNFELTLPRTETIWLELRNNATATAAYQFRIRTPETTVVPLRLNGVTTGAITEPGQRDVFTFQGGVGQKLFFDAQQNDFALIRYAIVSPSGAPVIEKNTDDENYSPFTLTENGTYRLTVDGIAGATGTYQFRVLSTSSASFVQLGTVVNAVLNPGLTSDIYHVQGSAGQRIRFDFTGTGYRWAFDSPGDVCIACSSTPSTNVVLTLPSTGVYVLSIRGSDGTGPHNYSFITTDVSDTQVTPVGLPLVQAGLLTASAESSFSFTANAGLQLLFDSLDADNDGAFVELRDPNDAIVFGQSASSDLGPFALMRSGTYTLKIRNNSTTSAADFSFRLTDLALASSVFLGATITQTIGQPFETDSYAIDGVAGQQLYLDARRGTLSNPRYRLVGPDGQVVFDATSNVGLGPVSITRTGPYMLLVSGAQSNVGDYSFRLIDLLAAPILPYESVVTDAITQGHEADAYRFSGQANQTVVIQSTTPAFNARAQLINAGNQLVTTFIIGQNTSVNLPRSGDYVIIVDGDAAFTQSYTLKLSPLVTTVAKVLPRTTVSTAPGRRTFTYDPAFSQPTGMVDELRHQTIATVDPATGNRLSLRQVIGAPGGDDDLVTAYTYTSHGLIDTTTDPLGRVTDYDYDAFDRLIRVTSGKGTTDQGVVRYEYDVAGNLVATVDENNRRREYQYDARNRITRSIWPDPDGAGPLAAPIVQLFYDGVGNVTQVIDALNQTWSYEYDSRDRMVRSVDPAGNATRSSYDAAGNLSTRIDPLSQMSTHEYDERNRLINSTDPDGGVTKFTYDADDQVIAFSDPLGYVTRYEYDARGRTIGRVDPLGRRSGYEWDLVDNAVSRTDRNGRRIEYRYDDVNRLVHELWVDGGNSMAYQYDRASNLTRLSDAYSTLVMSYDSRDRLKSIDNAGSADAPRVILNYGYDAAGNRISMADAIGSIDTGQNSYQHDALNRLTRLTQSGNNVADKRVEFGYNALGQFNSVDRFADLTGTQVVARSAYSYDTLNRLSSLDHRDASNVTVAFFDFTYDANSRIKKIVNVDGATDYRYDDRDQLIAASHSQASNPDENYGYDANGNRVVSQRHGDDYSIGGNNQLLSDGVYDYTYDAEGNLTLRTEIATGAKRQFTWDFRNRLTSVVDTLAPGNATQRVEYSYDGMNRRVRKAVDTSPGNAVDAVVEHFVYDGTDVLLDFVDPDGSGPSSAVLAMRYLHGPEVDQVLAQESGDGSVLWMLTDHLGSVLDLIDNSGAVANHRTLDSYGNLVSQTNANVKSRYGFTGREFDAETNLYFYRARYYDTQVGQFLSEDPVDFAGGQFDLYGYVGNAPNRFRDPSGLKFPVGEAWDELVKLVKDKVSNALPDTVKQWLNDKTAEKLQKQLDSTESELRRLHEKRERLQEAEKHASKKQRKCIQAQLEKLNNDIKYANKKRGEAFGELQHFKQITDVLDRLTDDYFTGLWKDMTRVEQWAEGMGKGHK